MSQRGSYQTRQQEAVQTLFSESPESCLTTEEAYLALLEKGLDIGKTTVYRSVTRLCQTGVLRRYVSPDSGGAARFQLNHCREDHMHIRCVRCGALAHLDCEEVEAFAYHLTHHHGFRLDESQTILYGLCENCQKANKES